MRAGLGVPHWGPKPCRYLDLRLLDDEGEAPQDMLKQVEKHGFPRSLGGVRPLWVAGHAARILASGPLNSLASNPRRTLPEVRVMLQVIAFSGPALIAATAPTQAIREEN
jgi:hypothetical protein